MIITSTIFFTAYGCLTMLGIYFRTRYRNAQKNTLSKEKIQLDELSVIVPFRNEKHRIEPLLNAIISSNSLPKNIVFVDDHSEDETVAFIQARLKTINHKIIQSDVPGKKSALLKGINSVDTKYILTIDADVHFHANYFNELSQLNDAEMHILPVRMETNRWNQLVEMDVYLINSLNDIAAGISHPIVASGANLLFDRVAYLNHHQLSRHKAIASGDDQFLLREFNKAKLTISISTNRNIAISTPAPNSIGEFFQQRFRWIAKSPKVKDPLATKIGIVQVTSTMLFGWIFLHTILSADYLLALAFVFLKSSLDGILAYNYLKKIGKTNCLLILPIYEILMPIYTITFILLLPFYRPNWKGRKI